MGAPMARGSLGRKRNNKLRFGTPKAGTVLHGYTPILTRDEARAERKRMIDERNAIGGRKTFPNIGKPCYDSGTMDAAEAAAQGTTPGKLALPDLSTFGLNRAGIVGTPTRKVKAQRRKRGQWIDALDHDLPTWEKACESLLYVATSVVNDPEHKDRRYKYRAERCKPYRMTYKEAVRLLCWANFDARPLARLDYSKLTIEQVMRKVKAR
jgi:hypothetical protein